VHLQEKIAALKAFIRSQENVVRGALQRSLVLKSCDVMKNSIIAVEMVRQAIVKEQAKQKLQYYNKL
jgi:hypothetical protein